MSNLFEINRAGCHPFLPHQTSGISKMPGQRREGGGPLPSIESDIQPLKMVKTAVVGQFRKKGNSTRS